MMDTLIEWVFYLILALLVILVVRHLILMYIDSPKGRARIDRFLDTTQ